MSKAYSPHRMDIAAFARDAATLSGEADVGDFHRLASLLLPPQAPRQVRWQAQGSLRGSPLHGRQPWLALQAEAVADLQCRRCLMPVQQALRIDRLFRFVPDERLAAAEDESSEEDVLAISREFDLLALVEDELMLALPLAPRHEKCPAAMPAEVADHEFGQQMADSKNPFAVLKDLNKKT